MRMAYVGAFASVFLFGCSSSGGLVSEPPAAKGPETPAMVTVQRDTEWFDGLLDMVFTLDGVDTYRLKQGESFGFELDPRTYTFGYRLGLNKCTQPVFIHAGTSYLFRLASHCVIESGAVPGGPEPGRDIEQDDRG